VVAPVTGSVAVIVVVPSAVKSPRPLVPGASEIAATLGTDEDQSTSWVRSWIESSL